jgi:hypothetical protein
MSLAIDTDDVKEVLLADGWHKVIKQSFCIDAYEYLDGKGKDAFCVHGGGQSGVCAAGFTFSTGKAKIAGPLTAILAVRY